VCVCACSGRVGRGSYREICRFALPARPGWGTFWDPDHTHHPHHEATVSDAAENHGKRRQASPGNNLAPATPHHANLHKRNEITANYHHQSYHTKEIISLPILNQTKSLPTANIQHHYATSSNVPSLGSLSLLAPHRHQCLRTLR